MHTGNTRLLSLVLVLFGIALCCFECCERLPRHGSRLTDGVSMKISGEPDTYLPGEIYTISLQSDDLEHAFTSFLLMADSEWSHELQSDTGTFQSYDTRSKFNESCKNAVVNADNETKTEVQIMWTAPSTRFGCVQFNGWAGSEEDHWWELRHKICAAPLHPHDVIPPIVEPCCACDEAKYEVTFEGLWSRHTHPKEFPKNESMTKFSDVIGASHTVKYRFWELGSVASDGLKQLAEGGHTIALETELKEESENIRTIIKARGMSYPHLNGKTFAVFRVDNRHHIVSLVAQLAPSPDWIVGVSGLELCLKNCTWTESKVLNLYPYDAGTDSGATYTSARSPQVPAGVVRPLGPDFPADADSPFYDVGRNEMKPFARLYLTRQRLYEKTCDPNLIDHNIGKSNADNSACATTNWSGWSSCSVTCGQGLRVRTRGYIDTIRAQESMCNKDLTDTQRCTGPRYNCKVPSEYEPDLAKDDGECAVSEWSPWSQCVLDPLSKCGKGMKVRTRKFMKAGAFKRCYPNYKPKPLLQQTSDCNLPNTTCKGNVIVKKKGPAKFVDVAVTNCRVTPWGEWSPCSAKCGRGRRMRTRIFIVPSNIQSHILEALTAIWNRKYMTWQSQENGPISVEEELMKNSNNDTIDELVRKHLDECRMTLTLQEVACIASDASCNISAHEAKKLCSLQREEGPCRSYMERWFFDADSGTCEPFGYSGCYGNRNNFHDRGECERVCGKYAEELKTTHNRKRIGLTTTSPVSLNDIPMKDQADDLINATFSKKWSSVSKQGVEVETMQA